MEWQDMIAGSWQGRPVWAEVDLDALAHNVNELKKRAGGATLLAVVKANAYGHGAVAVSRAALEAGADRLAVICVEEGEQLRLAGIGAPILVMGPTLPNQAERIVDLSLTPTVNSREMALALSGYAAAQGIVQPVHLKVETGLNRFGLPPEELVPLAEFLRELPGIEVEGLFTHFAAGDENDKTYTRGQFDVFMGVASSLSWIPLRHVSNTATVLDMPELSLEGVRPGIGIYGCYPSAEVSRSVALRPVLSLKSRVARLKRLSPGETVSYGRTWRAERPSIIALVACGYGDGLRRALSNRGNVLVRGQRVPIVGRVAMDMCVADVTDVPGVEVGDEIVLIGRQGGGEIPAEELAALCDTMNYEILCGITARVPRVYLRDGQAVAVESLLAAAPQEVTAERPLSVAGEHA
jgi:alanine racemase